jgi:hypothetical protein
MTGEWLKAEKTDTPKSENSGIEALQHYKSKAHKPAADHSRSETFVQRQITLPQNRLCQLAYNLAISALPSH